MSRNILLISYEPLSARLKSYIGQQSQKHIDCLNLPRSFFDEELSYDINEYIRYYENICRYLEDLPSPSLRNYLVVCTIWVDYEKYENWNPLLHYEVKRYRAYPP
ncbi:MAG: hypothetical protein GWN62_13590, partial [Aliifodinibius sp.]|nr:hypothetical protein [Fodinibius sp.]